MVIVGATGVGKGLVGSSHDIVLVRTHSVVLLLTLHSITSVLGSVRDRLVHLALSSGHGLGDVVMLHLRVRIAAASESHSKEEILSHDGDSPSMDGAQLGILEEPD